MKIRIHAVVICTLVSLCLLLLPVWAIAQTLLEQLVSGADIKIIRGQTVEVQAQVNIIFVKDTTSFIPLRDEVIPLLVKDPKIVSPPKLRVENLSLLPKTSKIMVSVGGAGVGEGYTIQCKLNISAEADSELGTYMVTIALPAVSEIAKAVKAVRPVDPPVCQFSVTVYETEQARREALRAQATETRQVTEREKVTTQGSRKALEAQEG